ncbi:hypothetical protein [Halobaculum roseum]|uniref:Zinc ribbon domain-containing protein n=1 Tax=Halobaculum roseum TaxID=2175149 RepID=A0ABD5MM57_9EURY|nr:hypothetical protein [Halobaculum roseum]QZY03728.1 hypothetical protein K6T36_06075 [Halobaculum roseum]
MRHDLVLASLLAGIGVAVLPGVLAFYLAAGPSVWLATGAAVAALGLAVAYTADEREDGADGANGDTDGADGDADGSAPPRVNCPECGARGVADGSRCEYCGAAFAE